MNNKHLIFALAILVLAFTNLSTAQAQKHGVGLRVGGYTSGISGKFFIKPDVALEAILGTGFTRRGFQLTGLYEKHVPALGVTGLQWFYGAGAHIGSFRGRYYHPRSYKRYEESYDRTLTTVGIDGIVGLEYQITEIPISLGLDFKPFIEVNRDGLFPFADGALTIRYTF